MRRPDFINTTGFRWGVTVATVATLGIALLFVFIYWQCAVVMIAPIDALISAEADSITSAPEPLLEALAEHVAHDRRHLKVMGLFDAAGQPIAGNLVAQPRPFIADGRLQSIVAFRRGEEAGAPQYARALGRPLADGTILVVGHNIDEFLAMRASVRRGLLLALAPAILLSLGSGAFLGLRAQQRLTLLRTTAVRIAAGQLGERLPVRARGDDLDALAQIVNRMLDEFERLVEDIKGVGEDIAHDLRTPLTWARARLERGRAHATSLEAMNDVVDQALGGIDQALNVAAALLRIAEVEHGQRHAAFGPVDLSDIVGDVGEVYRPLAEDRGIDFAWRLCGSDAAPLMVQGDRDLLIEALANLVDNAVKFAPPGGHVVIELGNTGAGPLLRVCDDGPGISPGDRDHVFRRFFRSDKSRHTQGTGLGLSLVAAVARLHQFGLTIGDNEALAAHHAGDGTEHRTPARGPGCVVELTCWPQAQARISVAPSPRDPAPNPVLAITAPAD
ncbi:MAG: HAMP domain-containing sensor histidine kinase [Azospirillaceae bacterium]|nr:HAMP domain-containing sensor histidine kinase [Azospirillaceae bacterium]